jgi:opacity protein-like surface antigen
MKKISLLAGLAALALAGSARAQSAAGTLPTTPVSVEVRAGAAIPIDEEGVKTGYTVGVNATYAVSPMLGIYAGYSFNSFGLDVGDADGSASARLQGFDAGVKASFPAGSITPFVRAGAVFQKASLSVSTSEGSGSFSDDSYKVGFELGGGVSVPLGPRLSVTPGASFVKVEDAKYVKADVGLSFHI